MRRVVRKLEEAAARMEERIEDPEEAARKAEITRQAKLAERMRELERERVMQEQRAAEISYARQIQQAAVKNEPFFGGDIRARLRRPEELRNAVVLREILGPPVGLR
jgi:hypothetical protein